MNTVKILGRSFRSDNLTGAAIPLAEIRQRLIQDGLVEPGKPLPVRRVINAADKRKRERRRAARRQQLEALHAADPHCHHCRHEVRLAPANARVDVACAVFHDAGGFITCGYCLDGPSPVALNAESLQQISQDRRKRREFSFA